MQAMAMPVFTGAIQKFMGYLQYERNYSPATIRNYYCDLEGLRKFLTPPGEQTMPIMKIEHGILREFVSSLYDRNIDRVSVARKLAAMRTFFKFCIREKYAVSNPAKLVATPKLPKRVPRVQTAAEMTGFLDRLPGGSSSNPSVTSRASRMRTSSSIASSPDCWSDGRTSSSCSWSDPAPPK